MNKQQLANKIWESANKMRSKIEANEYKDYILGFIFYKFLSDKVVEILKKDGYEDADIQTEVHENNNDLVNYCQQKLGYFIAYENLFSTWLAKGNSFTVDNVRTALSAFNRLISDTQKKVFSKIFNTLETGLSKLGDSTNNQTKAIRDLIQLIKDIPTDGKQDYDVLGFIYEYLIMYQFERSEICNSARDTVNYYWIYFCKNGFIFRKSHIGFIGLSIVSNRVKGCSVKRWHFSDL